MTSKKTGRGLLLAAAMTAAMVDAGETRRVEGLDFRRIDVLGSVTVKIVQGDTTELKMYGDADDLDRDPFYLRGDRLVLGTNAESRGRNFSDVKFLVEVPDLRELHLKGSGDVYLKPLARRESGGSFECSLDGSGDIKLFSVDASRLEMRVSGTGNIKAVDARAEVMDATVSGTGDLYIKNVEAQEGAFVVTGSGDIAVVESGTVDALEVNVVGSGDVDLKPVTARFAEVRIVGSGSAELGEVTTSVDCSILGSGDVRFDGDPQVESVELGSGECRSRD